ncbi:MAG TPA: DUF2283 domain-containing protein [Bacteroidota bacterium]
MKIYYDKKTDSVYLKLSSKKPDGVIEIEEGVNLDTTKDHRIVGIEILDASKKISLKSLLQLDLDDQLRALRKAS